MMTRRARGGGGEIQMLFSNMDDRPEDLKEDLLIFCTRHLPALTPAYKTKKEKGRSW